MKRGQSLCSGRQSQMRIRDRITQEADVVLIRVGNVYKARKMNSVLPVEITTPDTLGQGTAARILQITPQTFISTEAAVQVIKFR